MPLNEGYQLIALHDLANVKPLAILLLQVGRFILLWSVARANWCTLWLWVAVEEGRGRSLIQKSTRFKRLYRLDKIGIQYTVLYYI